jgi:hypothetical protein
MVGNISSAAQSISKGLTRLQTPEAPYGKGSNLSSEAGSAETKQDGSATSSTNNSGVGARLASALGRLSGSNTDNLEEPSKIETASKSVDVQISPQARRLMAMSEEV